MCRRTTVNGRGAGVVRPATEGEDTALTRDDRREPGACQLTGQGRSVGRTKTKWKTACLVTISPFRERPRPKVFRKITSSIRLPAQVIEEAFLKENPHLSADGLTVTCKEGYIQEVRICLSKSLEPVPCGRDVLKDCALPDAYFDPIR